MTSLLAFAFKLSVLAARVSDPSPDSMATRIGADFYSIGGMALPLRTVGCTQTAVDHPVRVSEPDVRGHRWLTFVGEGDPCLIAGIEGRR